MKLRIDDKVYVCEKGKGKYLLSGIIKKTKEKYSMFGVLIDKVFIKHNLTKKIKISLFNNKMKRNEFPKTIQRINAMNGQMFFIHKKHLISHQKLPHNNNDDTIMKDKKDNNDNENNNNNNDNNNDIIMTDQSEKKIDRLKNKKIILEDGSDNDGMLVLVCLGVINNTLVFVCF